MHLQWVATPMIIATKPYYHHHIYLCIYNKCSSVGQDVINTISILGYRTRVQASSGPLE